MVQFFTLLLAISAAGSVTAAPTHFSKRIAQVISASTTKWEAACDAAGGGQQCNPIAVNAFGTLLAAAGDCEQQDNADIMMDLSKKLNSADMIKFAQTFCMQPRNTPNSLSVRYCQKAPRNAELNGLFQCQFAGANPTNFVGGLTAGAPGTIPFGLKDVLQPPGSCPAHPNGPIPDGTQLFDQVSSPGVPSKTGPATGKAQSSSVSPPSATPSVPPGSSAASPPASPPASNPKGFAADNARDAKALNEKFKTLTADSPCNDGENACVGGGFAQCVGGKFAATPCSAGLECFALPLVNSRGTSIACDTQSDADARTTAASG